MTLDPRNPLDLLYLELIPERPSKADKYRMQDGPTAAFARLETLREQWQMVMDFPTEDEAVVA